MAENYVLAQLDEIPAVACPCGQSRRAFVSPENKTATLHMVDIGEDSAVHYHKTMTEIYIILEGTGHMEMDGQMVPVKPLTAVFIPLGAATAPWAGSAW